MTVYIQVANYRRREQQILDENGAANWDLTGATAQYVLTDPSNGAHAMAATLGKFTASGAGQAADIAAGWVHATYTSVNANGTWKEQFRIVLAGGETLNGPVTTFVAKVNLPTS